MFLYLQSFENGEYQADLSDTPPHVIAAVLKLYLRQVSKLKSVPPPHLMALGQSISSFKRTLVTITVLRAMDL